MVYSKPLQTELNTLLTSYEDRGTWWDGVIGKIETAETNHKNRDNQAARRLNAIVTGADGFYNAQKILLKKGSAFADQLGTHYSDQKALQQTVYNPLNGVPITSVLSRSPTNSRFYGTKFWNRYEQLLKDGKHDKAQKMLQWGDGRIRRTMLRLIGGSRGVAQWRSDIQAAAEKIDEHRAAHVQLKTVDGGIQTGQKNVADAIRTILNDKYALAALRNPTTAKAAATRPALDLMVRYAALSTRPSAQKIMGDINAQRATFSVQTLEADLLAMENIARPQIAPARAEKETTGARLSTVRDFLKSCRLTEKMETQFSLVIGAVSRDVTGNLFDLAAGYGDNEDAAKRVLEAAKAKRTRWVDPALIDANFLTVSNLAFSPTTLGTMPSKRYLTNAFHGSMNRAGHELAREVRQGMSRIVRDFNHVRKPVQKALHDLHHWVTHLHTPTPAKKPPLP